MRRNTADAYEKCWFCRIFIVKQKFLAEVLQKIGNNCSFLWEFVVYFGKYAAKEDAYGRNQTDG